MHTSLKNPPSTGAVADARPTTLQLEHVCCPLCGSNDEELVLEACSTADCEVSTWRMVRCSKCRLCYTNPRPDDASIARFYPDDYECHDLSTAWDSRPRVRLRRHFEHAVLRTHFGYPPQSAGPATRLMSVIGQAWIRRASQQSNWVPFEPGGRLIDFGCGAGEFLQRMQQLGWSVQGIDMSPSMAAGVSRRLGVRVHAGTLPHPDVPPDSADAITMWQVLEHVHDPVSTLRAVGEVLRPGGRLHLSVPNVASRSFAVFREHWHALELPRHLTHFSPDTLGAVLKDAGFEIDEIRVVGRSGWIRQSVRIAQAAGCDSSTIETADTGRKARALARETETAGDADMILAIARRP